MKHDKRLNKLLERSLYECANAQWFQIMQTKMYPLEILYCLKQSLKCEWHKNVKKTHFINYCLLSEPSNMAFVIWGIYQDEIGTSRPNFFYFSTRITFPDRLPPHQIFIPLPPNKIFHVITQSNFHF